MSPYVHLILRPMSTLLMRQLSQSLICSQLRLIQNNRSHSQNIQFSGDKVLKVKDGTGSAMLSMAYAGAAFAIKVIQALAGCSYSYGHLCYTISLPICPAAIIRTPTSVPCGGSSNGSAMLYLLGTRMALLAQLQRCACLESNTALQSVESAQELGLGSQVLSPNIQDDCGSTPSGTSCA